MGKRKKQTEGITVGVSCDLNLMGLKKPIIRGILEDWHRSSRGGAEEHFCQQSQNQIPKESPNVQINPNEVVINI